jgi:acetyl esterase
MALSYLVRTRAQIMRTIAPRLLKMPGLRQRLIGWRAEPIDGNVCDESLATLLGIGDRIGATDMGSRTPTVARNEMAESSAMVEDEPCPDVTVTNRILLDEGVRIPARTYIPKGIESNSAGIVYYHGGGFALGDLDTHDRYCQHLAREVSARVIAIDYRLAPENPFPAGLDDGLRAFRCVARRAREFDMDPKRLVVMGDSAGGNLSAVVAHKTKNDAIKPALQVLIYPAVDGSCTMKSHQLFGKGWLLTSENIEQFYHWYVGDEPAARRQPDVSPIYANNFQGLPPALVYTAGFDPLRDEGQAYAERLSKEGIPTQYHCFRSLTHGFASMGGVCPAAREAALHIAGDVRNALRNGLLARTDAAA